MTMKYMLLVTAIVGLASEVLAQVVPPPAGNVTGNGTVPQPPPAPITPAPPGSCKSLIMAAEEAGLTKFVETVNSLSDLERARGLFTQLNAQTESATATKITVFAPQNEAFDEVGEFLTKIDVVTLYDVVANHVLRTNFPSQQILASIVNSRPNPATSTSVYGGPLLFQADGFKVAARVAATNITGNVGQSDIATCAGTLHVVDKVLLPTRTVRECIPLGEQLEVDQLNIFAKGIQDLRGNEDAANLISQSQEDVQAQPRNRLTLFAPTDAAFQTFAATGLTFDVLRNHFVDQPLPTATILSNLLRTSPNPLDVRNQLGRTLSLSSMRGTFRVSIGNITATVTKVDVQTCAGIIHIIDSVLVPPPTTELQAVVDRTGGSCVSIAEAASQEGLSLFLENVLTTSSIPRALPFLEAVVHNRTLPSIARITMFAPNDAAFRQIDRLDLDDNLLLLVLINHAILQDLPSEILETDLRASIPNPLRYNSAIGRLLDIGSTGQAFTVTPPDTTIVASVTKADVKTCIGTLHIIDSVLVPPLEASNGTNAINPA